MAQALKFEDAARGGEREPGGCLVFILQHFGEEHLGTGGEATVGHLLGIAHQFIKVNFWSSDKRSAAPAALDDSFMFERGEGVGGGYEACVVVFGELGVGGYGVPGRHMS